MTVKHPFSFDLYTIKDVFGIWKRSWKTIIFGMVLLGLFGTYWSLSEPIRYTAEASFREKNHSRGGVTSSNLTALLLSQSNDSNDSVAVSTMKSRSMMEQVIKREGMQAKVVSLPQEKSLLDLMQDNLRVEYALLTNHRVPVLPDAEEELFVKEILYNGETPIAYTISFQDENTFILSGNGIELQSNLGTPITINDASFVILGQSQKPLSGKEFGLILMPLAQTAKDLSKLVVINTDKDDNSLLRIRYRNEDRHQAMAFVNTLMKLYQDYIDAEHKKMMDEQISYLQKRQNEVFASLQKKMKAYADTLSEDFSSLGFIDSQRAMEFLASNQHAIKGKQLAIGQEIQRLESARHEGKLSLETLSAMADYPFLNKLLMEIRDLKQQYDSIQVALSTSNTLRKSNYQDAFEQNMDTLSALSICQSDTCNLIAQLKEGKVPSIVPPSLKSSEYLVNAWHAKLQKDLSPVLRTKFLVYLQNLLHHLRVYSNAIEENLAHQQNPSSELQGINLQIANDLFLTYNKELSQIEGQILQYDFMIEQLLQPEFELSSLTALLNDSISKEIANNASTIVLAINDKSNRTEKELARLQEELRLQRKFLTLHLKQTKDLLAIKLNLLQDKIREVRQATLGIIQETISVAENQTSDHIRIKIVNLQQELVLLEKQQEELQNQMAVLPKKWVSEQLIHQHMEMQKQMSKEITNLVESKNISSNLEIMQSAPLDSAIVPLHPDSPRLLFFAFFGAFTGLFLTAAWTLVRSLNKGIPASSESLKFMGLQVIGNISSAKNCSQAVKRLVSLLTLNAKADQRHTLLIAQKNSTIAHQLEKQFIANGYRAKAVSWNATFPEEVQWVLAYANLSPADPEILNRFEHFDHFIAVLKDEPLFELEPLIERIQSRSSENHQNYFLTSF